VKLIATPIQVLLPVAGTGKIELVCLGGTKCYLSGTNAKSSN